MAILKLIFRKMFNNRWLTGSLFLGLIISVSLVASIPTYTASILQKLLTRELEEYQIKTNQFPGEFTFSDTFISTIVDEPSKAIKEVEKIKQNIIESVELPVLSEANIIATEPLKTRFAEEDRRTSPQSASRLIMITNLEDNISIIDGTYPSAQAEDGVIEALVSEQALVHRNTVLGVDFNVSIGDKQFTIKPVGVFQQKSGASTYWSLLSDTFSSDFIVHEEFFRDVILTEHEEMIGIGRFSTAFDYHQITNEDFSSLLALESRVKRSISKIKEESVLINFPIRDILRSYQNKEKQLTSMLWALNVPVLIMLAIYLYMISRQIIDRQLNEIAVFSSRGASRLQIFFIYLIEIVLLAVLAFILGPLISLQLVKVLGASNGFLEFVQRSALPVELSPKSLYYALIAAIASVVMIMIPVYRASGRNIVVHKQETARSEGKVQWYIVLFEVVVLAISIYGLYVFNRRQEEMVALDIDSTDLMIDPSLFFMPALFMIGLGLVALRVYPLVLRLIYKIGEKIWPVSLYSTFLQVSRSTKQYKFLMLFLVMTIGMGVFSASAARTINTNLEEQLLYQNGAEVSMRVRWESSQLPTMASPTQIQTDNLGTSTEPVIYSEPPFDPIVNLSQVEQATKVFIKNQVTVADGVRSVHYPTLMAIEPKQFGEVAWFKPSLLPYHWYQYLNLLATEQSAILISKKFSDSFGIKEGDYVTISWSGSDTGEFVVYGVIDYWPTFNPLETGEGSAEGSLIVANLPYVQNTLGLEPYDVWLKLKEDASRETFYKEIEEAQIPVTSLNDVVPKIIDLKNGSLLLGLNGTMTLGFLISLLVSFIGFLLYWILTIKSRTLQYGIYRAIGISMPNLIGILLSEQILTSGFACLLGVIGGKLTSQLFVPLFQVSMNVRDLVPPFSVVFDASDEMKIYIFSAFMLVLGSIILIGFLRKIKINQAIKLGEDQ